MNSINNLNESVGMCVFIEFSTIGEQIYAVNHFKELSKVVRCIILQLTNQFDLDEQTYKLKIFIACIPQQGDKLI